MENPQRLQNRETSKQQTPGLHYLVLLLLNYYYYYFVFLGPHPQHMEVPRLGVESERQLQAHTPAHSNARGHLICDLPHSLQRWRILNPLSEAKDQTHILMETSQFFNLLSHKGNSLLLNY